MIGVSYKEIYEDSDLLTEFFNSVYVAAFPDENERESLEFFIENLKMRSEPEKKIKVIKNVFHPLEEEAPAKKRFHVLVAMHQKRVVGGVVFDFMGCDEDICFGTVWWTVVRPEYRCHGIGTKLTENAIKVLKKDAKTLGYENFDGLIGEINNPEKMTHEELKCDTMDAHERISFWRHRGYRLIKGFDYVQLTSDPESYVEYCDLYVIPLTGGEWVEGKIRARDLLSIVSHIAVLGSGLENLLDTEPFMKMVRSIRKQEEFILH
ncbi:MAG: GNAT family N-acetyltransferase [archaeon]